MNVLLPDWPLFSAFLVASLILAITPGPGVFYIVTRSLVQGRAYGLVSVLGVAVGNFGNVCVASFGLAALFVLSENLFIVIKYLGAAYLIYLGVQMWRSSPEPSETDVAKHVSLKRIFFDGFLVALFNPKTMLFFAAFLPQFFNPEAAVVGSGITLGAIFVAIATLTDSFYALAAGSVASILRNRGLHNTGRRIGAGVFIGLGVLTALGGLRSSR